MQERISCREKRNVWGVIDISRFVLFLSLIVQILFVMITNINAQSSKFPVYDNQRIERPSELRHFEGGDFSICLTRIDLYPNGFLFGDQQTIRRLGIFLLHDPNGDRLWKEEARNAANTLSQWDFNRNGFGADRYIYNVSQLQNLSLVYLFTGNKDLGSFIRSHVLQIAKLPFEFWLHSELRGYNPNRPLGMLETSDLCSTIAMTVSATKELYSSAEKKSIDEALRTKGLMPCLNWLENPNKGNFTAVISSGAYVAAKYLNDFEGMGKALKAMTKYLNGSIETDGSYGEGTGYFNYPISSLMPSILCMNTIERTKVFSSSGLRNSATWRLYPYLFSSNSDEKLLPTILHFGDNSFLGATKKSVNSILGLIYRDPLAIWLMDKFGETKGIMEWLLVSSFPEGLPKPKSPEQANLPLLKIFNNGDCFIRSTWNDCGIVLAMRSGDGSLIRFNHQRPELSSICMGAYGEYLIVSPGSASYRSPLHYQYDLTTRSANTISIDDKNQLFPGNGQSAWNQTDITNFWKQGKPKAEVVQCKAGNLADLIVNEAAEAYHIPMKYVRRSILFIRDPGYFVVVDKILAIDSLHRYTWRLHLNNRDGFGKITTISQSHWHFSRPSANLDIYLYSDQNLKTNIGQGYMHGPERDYSPGGINEGKAGSAIELEAFNAERSKFVSFYTILYPSKGSPFAHRVEFSGENIVVDKDTFSFSEGECVIKKARQTERFKLW